MSNRINCENPSCGTVIDVPLGALQVICPQCNTWHFPDNNQANDYSNEPVSTPETPPLSGVGQGYGEPIIPIPSISDLEESEPELKRGASRQVGTIGYLLTPEGSKLLLRQGKNIIGRKNADLIINDRTVSRRHCVIEVNMRQGQGGWEFTIYDIGHLEGSKSTNGVFISGRSLRLQDYERISIGHDSNIQLGNVLLTLKCN